MITSSVGTSIRYKLWWSILLTFLVSKRDLVLLGLNVTSHLFDELVILSRYEFIKNTAFSGVSTIMYKLVSSAIRRMSQCISRTMSFIYNIKGRGPTQNFEGSHPRFLPNLKSPHPSPLPAHPWDNYLLKPL